MSSKKILKQINDKNERQALQKLIERYHLQDFNIEIGNGHVKALSIKFKNLKEIPEEINALSDLESLDLSRNQIQIISGLTQLIRLRSLKLRENQIKKIENLVSLIQLIELDLSENQIEELDGLFNLRKLDILELNRNRIKKLARLERCEKLRVLKINGNPIEKIEGLEKLQNLEVLLLARANIKKIEGLEQLRNLRELNLALNQISKIEGIENNLLLRQLNLNDNKIRNIENIGHLTFLQEILLLRNDLRTEEMAYISKPAKMIVAYCQKKAEEHKKNMNYRKKIKQERDNFQIEEELAINTVVQTMEETQKAREKLTNNNHQSKQSHNENVSNHAENPNEINNHHNDLNPNNRPEKTNHNITDQSTVQEKIVKPWPPQKYTSPFSNNIEHRTDESIINITNSDENKQNNRINWSSQHHSSPFPENSFQKLDDDENDEVNYLSDESKNENKSNILLNNSNNNLNQNHPKIQNITLSEENISLQNNQPVKFDLETNPRSTAVPVPNVKIETVLNQNFESETDWLNFANRLNQQEDYSNALLAYRNVIQLNTRNIEAWMYSGVAFNNKGDYRRSIRAFKQALAISPNNALLWMYLGIGFYNTAQFEDAVKSFNESLTLDASITLSQQYLDQIPEEFKKDLNLFEKQTELLAHQSQQVEDQLYEQLNQYSKAYREIEYQDLLTFVKNAPYITDIPSLKHKITDLVLQNRINVKLFLNHLEFLPNQQKPKRTVVKVEEKFEVLKLLAFTNFSKLWLAEDRESNKKIVLKHIIYKDNPTFRKLTEQMALREISLLSKIKSQHIISLEDSFLGEYQQEWGYILKLPYYQYGTLDRRIKSISEKYHENGKLIHPKAILTILIGLLKGVIAIHEAGIVHRDIKPSNIIINTKQEIPSPSDIILIDFGIATAPQKVSGTDFTIAGGCGTRGFSPPEQLESPHVDFNADIFAVGATIYYAMTLNKYSGQFYLPEYANNYYQIIQKIFPLLQKMLENEPTKRYSNVEELYKLVNDLTNVVDSI